MIKAKVVIFPSEDGFSVLIWGKWAEGTMRVRRFDNRISMIALLKSLQLITPSEAQDLEHFGFMDSCPLYSAEIDEDTLADHDFHSA